MKIVVLLLLLILVIWLFFMGGLYSITGVNFYKSCEKRVYIIFLSDCEQLGKISGYSMTIEIGETER